MTSERDRLDSVKIHHTRYQGFRNPQAPTSTEVTKVISVDIYYQEVMYRVMSKTNGGLLIRAIGPTADLPLIAVSWGEKVMAISIGDEEATDE